MLSDRKVMNSRLLPGYFNVQAYETQSLKPPRDRLLAALKREHGAPRYDYPPKLVRYYKLEHVETKKA